MAKQSSASDSDGTSAYNAVFIDTSLGTHFATIVSSSETVSDLKKKLMREHALCFPHFGDIKIHALKIKRRGNFYFLSESMFVKNVFHGLNKSWFIAVDASSSEEQYQNMNFHNTNSNNLVGKMNEGLANAALPEIHSSLEKLANGVDNLIQKLNASRDEYLGLDVGGGEGYRNMEIGVKLTEGNRREAISPDANNRSGPSILEKGDHYDKQNKVQKTSVEGDESSCRTGTHDEPGSIPSEERSAETISPKKKKKKSKRKGKHNVNDFASKEDNPSIPESGINRSQKETVVQEISLGNTHGVVSHDMPKEIDNIIDGPSTISSSDANKATVTIVQRATLLTQETGVLEKHVELNNAESRKNNANVQKDQSVEEKSKSDPAAKGSCKSKQAKKGDEDLPKDDGTLISGSDNVMLEHSTISQNSLVDKQNKGNPTLDGSSIVTPEAVHLQSVSPSSKKRKRRKKSAKALDQGTVVVPSFATNVGVESFEVGNNPLDLGEKPAAEHVSGQFVQDSISSEPEAVFLNEKHVDPIQQINLRPSLLESDTSNKDADNVEGRHEASESAIASYSKRKRVSKDHHAICEENYPIHEFQASDKTEKENEVSIHENMIHNVHQNHPCDQNHRVEEEREFSLKHSPITAPSEKYKTSAQHDVVSKTKEVVVASKLLEARETVDPPRSSKKKKKSKKSKDLVSAIPSTSVTVHVESFVSNASPTEPHKAGNGDHPGDTFNKEESNRPPVEADEALEMNRTSTSFLATDKEINDVIQSVVESVRQIGEDQVDTENIHGKSRKKFRKKLSSDAKHLQELKNENVNVGKNAPALSTDNTGEINYSSVVTKQATLANTDTISQLIGSNLECRKETLVENDLGTQSVQVQPHKPEGNSEKRCLGAVIPGNPSKSGPANEGTDDMEISCERSRVNFLNYFARRKHDLETAGSGEKLVDGSTKTNGAYDGMKANKKKKKHDAQSDDFSPELQTSQKLNDSCGVGVKLHTGNSSTVQVQVPSANAESEKITFQPDKEPSKVSNNGVKALPSSKSHKLNSVSEEARESNDLQATGIHAHAKSKMAESNSGLKSYKKISLKRRADGRQSLEDHNHVVDGRKRSTIETGELVNSAQKEKSLIGVSCSIFKDDSDGASSNENGDSDASTRTPSDGSLSSDYSDGESNADFNLPPNGSYSWKRKDDGKTIRKPISSGMTLDTILRSSSRYKKAKLTASQSLLDDTENQPVDFVPDSQPNP